MDVELSVRNGVLTGGSFGSRTSDAALAPTVELPASLHGRRLHEITSWEAELDDVLGGTGQEERSRLCDWLHAMLPSPVI